MSKAHSTVQPAQSKPAEASTTAFTTVRSKPEKPYPDFPLYAHPAGYWAKKIRSKFYYFGKWDDPQEALTKYLEQKDSLHAGRKPRPDPNALTMKELANLFLDHKRTLVDSRELTARMWRDYKTVCDLTVAKFGKRRLVDDLGPDDFAALRKKMAAKWGPVTLGNAIQRIRSVFKYADDSRLIARPVVFGPGFKRPSKKTLRLERAKRGPKLFTADEIRALIGAARTQVKAMILLGINCGYGNADCGTLPMKALDLDRGWLEYPRPKTGIPRRCPLWPETVSALREVLAKRKEPKDAADAGLLFVTKYGQSWTKTGWKEEAERKRTQTAVIDNPIGKETAKLLRELGINGRKGLGFYTLRHTFRTIADETKDQPAIDYIMGHARDDMASVSRERISDERLRAVTDYVRAWLFGKV
jgi:integrase